MEDQVKTQDETAPTVQADGIVPPYVRVFAGQEVKAVDEASRSVTHLITTGAIDRMGDIVEPSGAALENFQKNPVVLANHSYRIEDVIGRATDIRVGKDGITATTQFRETPLADAAYKLTRERLGGWSIGFRPTDSHSVKDGSASGCKSCKRRWEDLTKGKEPGEYVSGGWARHYTTWEMLEYSSVAIPANQEIVNNAVSRGLVAREMVPQFFNVSEHSITPEPAKSAAPGPKVEAVELHPVLVQALSFSIKATKQRLDVLAASEQIRKAKEMIDGK